MNCERCREQLEDFLYSELSAAQTGAVREHLRGCIACRSAFETLEREQDLFAQYYEQAAQEPAPEMWAAIRRRITAEKASAPVGQANLPARLRAWFGGLFLAPALLRQTAFAALLVIVSVAATSLYFRFSRESGAEKERAKVEKPAVVSSPSPETAEVTPAPSPSSVEDGESSAESAAEKAQRPAVQVRKPVPPVPRRVSEDELIQQQVARAAREYQNAIRLLEQKIARRRDSLDPVLLAQYASSLALIDKSIAESRQLMRERPTDPTAGQYLLVAYARKVELMQEIALQ